MRIFLVFAIAIGAHAQVGPVSRPGTYSASPKDASSFTTMADYRTTGNVACDPAQFFHSVQYKFNASATVVGTICDTAVDSNVLQLVGGHFTATTGHASTTAVAVNAYAFSLANNSKAFSVNTVWQDVPGLTKGVSGIGAELDWQPQNPPSAYTYSAILHAALINNRGNNGTYPVTALMISAGNNFPGSFATFKTGINVLAGAIGPDGQVMNINPMRIASAGKNYSAPIHTIDYVSYWDDTVNKDEYESFGQQAIVAPGNNPGYDAWSVTHNCSPGVGCPKGQQHYFSLASPGMMFQAPLHTPSSSSEPCSPGASVDDSDYHYVCTAPNKWKRVALSAW